MRTSKFSESKILEILKQAEVGVALPDLCRQQGISQQTFYRWRAKYGGTELSEIQRLRQLEAENSKLKRVVADQAVDIQILKDVLSGKYSRP
jgi:putative transposase